MPRGSGVVRYEGRRGVVWRIKFLDADGKQVMETIGAERDGVTRKIAEAELRERLVRVERKHYRRPKPLTFGEWARTWYEEGQNVRDWKPQTVAVYRGVVRHLVDAFGTTRLASIRAGDVAAYVREALADETAPRTINLHLNVLHDILATAGRRELIDGNPVDGVERPRVRRRRWRILTPSEVPRVGAAFADERSRAVFWTLMLTGVRRFELQAMRWRDVDMLAGVLRIPESKTEEGERSIALDRRLVGVLAARYQATRFRADSDFVFAHPQRGSKLDAEWYAEQFQKALAAAGIPDYVRPFHDMRHTSLTNGAAAGELPLELMTRAGHRSISTTQQYLDLAGVTFPDKATALADRMLGGVELSTHLSSPQAIEGDAEASSKGKRRPADVGSHNQRL